jgi:transposase
LHPEEQKRPDVQEQRKDWVENQQPKLDANKIVFLDESSINLGMTRLYGRAHTNERVNDYVPDVRFERTSILSSIRLDGTQIPIIFKGTLNGELFKLYVDNFLAPSLSEGDVIILDNSSVHRAKGVLDSIIAKGVKVLFLPPYSPDFNPIEMLWSKMKSLLRKAKARTHEMLVEALNYALDCITINDITNWFKHDGYNQQ